MTRRVPAVPGHGVCYRSGRERARARDVFRLTSRVDLRAEAEVEADRLEDVGRGAGRVDVGGREYPQFGPTG